jgi:hypothetical protein
MSRKLRDKLKSKKQQRKARRKLPTGLLVVLGLVALPIAGLAWRARRSIVEQLETADTSRAPGSDTDLDATTRRGSIS